MKDRTQLNLHPLNARARKILKAAKIPWTKQETMAISALMLWTLTEKGVETLPAWAALETFQDRYADLEEAVADLDRRDPEVLLELVERGEDAEDVAVEAKDLLGLTPEEAGAMLLEELRWGMEFHPEKYQ